MILFDEVVAVPRLNVAVIALHDADTALDEAARYQKLSCLKRVAVHFADVGGLFGQVERIGRFELHTIGELKGLDARLELRVVSASSLMFGVELGEQVELAPLHRAR